MTAKEKAHILIADFLKMNIIFCDSGFHSYLSNDAVAHYVIKTIDEMICENNLHFSKYGNSRIKFLNEVKEEVIIWKNS